MLIKSVVFSLIVIIMFFIISWKMTLFTFAVMLPTMFIGPIYGKAMRRINKAISDGKADASSLAEEAFSNIRTVKAFATEDHEATEYSKKNNHVFKQAKEQALCYGVFNFFMQFIMFGSLDALIYFAAFLNKNGGLTIGQFTSFQFYMFSFLMNFMQIASVLGEVMGVFGTGQAIAEIFLYVQKINTTGGEQVTQSSLDEGSIKL